MNHVTRRRVLLHPPEHVWTGLTDPEALASWLGETDLVPEEGRAFTLRARAPFGRTLLVRGEVVTAQRPHRLELTWRHDAVESRVSLELHPHPRGTELIVRHRGLRGVVGLVALFLFWDDALARVPGVLGLRWPWVVGGAGALGVALWLLLPRAAELPQPVTTSFVPASASAAPADPVVPIVVRKQRAVADTDVPVAAPVTEIDFDVDDGIASVDLPEDDELSELLAALAVAKPVRTPPEPTMQPQPGGGPKGVVRIRGGGHPRLNPVYARRPIDTIAQELLFDRVFEVEHGEVKSHIVRSHAIWPGKAGISVKLRTDVRWSDGKKLRPHDVCWTWQTFVDPATNSPHREKWESRIASCEVKDKWAHIGLTRAWEDPRRAVDLPLLPSHVFDGYGMGEDYVFSFDPVGSGAMSGNSHRRGARFEAEPRGSRQPRIARVDFLPDIDRRLEVKELARGDVDVLVDIDGSFLGELRDAGAALYPLRASMPVVAYDPRDGVTFDVHVRVALDKALQGESVEDVLAPHAIFENGLWLDMMRKPLTVRMAVSHRFDAEQALTIQNLWLRAGFLVEFHRVNSRDLYDDDTDDLSKRFDVALLEVDLLTKKDALQPLVERGPGNPFDARSEGVGELMRAEGEEDVLTWLRVAELLEKEHLYTLLGTNSSWVAVGRKVHATRVDRDHPLLSFHEWTIP